MNTNSLSTDSYMVKKNVKNLTALGQLLLLTYVALTFGILSLSSTEPEIHLETVTIF